MWHYPVFIVLAAQIKGHDSFLFRQCQKGGSQLLVVPLFQFDGMAKFRSIALPAPDRTHPALEKPFNPIFPQSKDLAFLPSVWLRTTEMMLHSLPQYQSVRSQFHQTRHKFIANFPDLSLEIALPVSHLRTPQCPHPCTATLT